MSGVLKVPEVGEIAPDFELLDTEMKPKKLGDYRDKRTVLAFFPAAESPVCTVEFCSFRDSIDQLRDYGANVVGVSVDGPFANKAFAKNHHFSFPILSDYKRDVIRKYGIVMKDLGAAKDYNAAKRSVFILDESGKVIYKWVTDNPQVEPNYSEIKQVLSNNQKKNSR